MVAIDDRAHPIYRIIKHIQSRLAKRHPSPIHILDRLFKLEQGSVTPPLLHSLEDVKHVLYRCTIADSREKSIDEEANCRANYKVYTDGSKIDGGIGASSVMLDTIKRQWSTLKHHLGSETDHTIYDAELVGILMAIHMIGQIPANATVAVFSNNQSTLQAITKPPDGPAGHIILYVNNVMRALSTRRPILTRNLRFHWISSHSGVHGNELADRAAKEAARGATSPDRDLPAALTAPFPRSSTAIWTAYKEGMDKKWMAAFAKTPRGVRLLRFDRNFHPRRYYKLAKGLHRSHTSIINQLRSGHVALNTYLHRIKRRDDPFCEHCPQTKETVRHYVLECPARREARRTTLDPLGRYARDLSHLLSTTSGTTALRKFISASGRFVAREGVG